METGVVDMPVGMDMDIVASWFSFLKVGGISISATKRGDYFSHPIVFRNPVLILKFDADCHNLCLILGTRHS